MTDHEVQLEELKPYLKKAKQTLTSTRAKGAYVGVASLIAAIAVFVLSVMFNGVVATMVYAVLFVVFLTAIPTAIGVLGHAVPGNKSLAKLQIVLGAVAFNHHYLVQTDDGWEWCAGDENHYYLNGTLHGIDGGFENRSVMGWRPFGVLRHKTDQTLQTVRTDIKAERDRAAADGGESQIERGGYSEAEPPIESGIDGQWLVDLKRVFSSGIRKIGDIDLIETAEEMIERGQVDDSRMAGWRPVIGSLVGMMIGAGIAYLMVMG